jgi:hypothetical protein
MAMRHKQCSPRFEYTTPQNNREVIAGLRVIGSDQAPSSTIYSTVNYYPVVWERMLTLLHGQLESFRFATDEGACTMQADDASPY